MEESKKRRNSIKDSIFPTDVLQNITSFLTPTEAIQTPLTYPEAKQDTFAKLLKPSYPTTLGTPQHTFWAYPIWRKPDPSYKDIAYFKMAVLEGSRLFLQEMKVDLPMLIA